MTTAPVTRTSPITFADFVPGTELGRHAEVCTAALAQAWDQIFGQDEEAMAADRSPAGVTTATGAACSARAASIAVAMSMRAFLTVAQPRPPGNVHARERFTLHALPRVGETVQSVIFCEHKEMRRERRYVDLRVEGLGAEGRPLYTGLMSLIWAA